VNGKAYGVKLGKDSATVNGTTYPISVDYGINEGTIAESVAAAPVAAAPVAGSGPAIPVEAPMPGLVLRIDVKVGQSVKKNELLMVMEAMKMENEIYAPADGVVTKISVSQGQQLQSGDELMVIG
ncbi:MAG TPA: acetyl-CoA carboxylase biotin carboxyl carrier protein subunit, partial [Sphaerochaeta sp.]|nr:acetyl-CoA carboxylase biotin carboxyl carrier protein subunit [Sphaerochaeta sp.]